MALQYSSLEIADFSGGKTDYPFQAPINMFEELDNLVIDPNNKAIQRPGSLPFITDIPELPVPNARPHNVTTLSQETVFVAAEDKIYYPDGTWTEVAGIGGVPAFNVTSGTTRSIFAEWNRHLFATTSDFALPIKIYLDAVGVPQVRTAGLPIYPDTFTVTPAAPAAAAYIYYIVYKYTYASGAVQFLDLSSPGAKQTLTAASPPNNTIGNITGFVNTSGSSWDVNNITVEIYRTVNGGQVAYFLTSLPNPLAGTTSYVDTTTDAVIQANETLYTTVGIQPYDPPPACKFVHIMNGRGYYAYTKVGVDEYPTRVYQSIQDDPDSVPPFFFLEVRDEIMGISSYANNPIVFGKNKVYRLDGYFDELGRNGAVYEEISKITGCVSNNSIVQTDLGVFFAGQSGFYFTDGYKFMKISDHLNITYKTIVSDPEAASRIFGTYDANEKRVYWAVSIEGDTENDTIFSLDLTQPLSDKSCFTTWSNGNFFKPTALAVLDGDLIRCDPRGYVFRHLDTQSNDPRIDDSIPYADWGTKAIIFNIKTAHMNFGLPQIRKWASRILVTVRNLSNISIQINSINNDSDVPKPLKVIRFRDLLTWGDPNPIWGDASLVWFFQGLVEQWRRFPVGSLRFSYKQIQITNADCIIYRSDEFSTLDFDTNTLIATLTNFQRILTCSSITNVNVGDTVTGDTTAAVGTVTAVTPYSISVTTTSGDFAGETSITDNTSGGSAVITAISIFAWPDDMLDFSLNILPNGAEDDPSNYPISLPIVSRIDDQNILVSDPLSILDNYTPPTYTFDDIKWYITGVPKNETLSMQNFVTYYAPISATQKTYQYNQADGGENS
jgi:hypothetical protein